MTETQLPVQRLTPVGSSTISADFWGSGSETFLLLHGIPGWRGSWRAVAMDLARSATVVVPDLLGFGESTEPPSLLHAEGHAASLIGFLASRGLGPVHLSGFDFGGPTACALIRMAPDRVKSLTLISTNVFPDTPIPLPLKIARVPGLGAAVLRVMMGEWGLSMMWWAAVRQKNAFSWRRYRQALNETGVRSTRRIFLESLRRLDELYGPIAIGLSRVAVPAQVIWGDSDPFFSTSIGRRTAAAIPGARYVELAGCGHFVPEEHPTAVARELRAIAGLAIPSPAP